MSSGWDPKGIPPKGDPQMTQPLVNRWMLDRGVHPGTRLGERSLGCNSRGLDTQGLLGMMAAFLGKPNRDIQCIHTYIHACMHACIHTYIYIYTYSNSICCFIKCFISFCYIFIYVYIGGFLFLPQGKIGDVCCELGTLQHVGESNELPDVPCSRSNQAPRHGPRQTSFWAVAGSDRTGATWLHGTLCQDGKLTTRWNIGPPFCWS